MAKLTLIQTSFNAGELSPDLAGHIDLDRYQNGAKVELNVVPQVSGGAKRRDGSRLLAPTKTTGTTRLIPFVFNKSQAYVLELGDSYVRFFSSTGQLVNAGVPLEVSSPWTAANVFSVEFAQGSDTMFMAHPASPMKRLVRILQTAWSIDDAPFDPAPIDEIGTRPPATMHLSLTSGAGTGVASTSAAVFHPADVGRNIVTAQGMGLITGIASPTQANYTVTSVFSSADWAPNGWKIDQSPMAPVTPSNKSPVDGGIRLVVDGPPIAVATVSLTGTTMTVATVDPHGLIVGETFVLSGFESAGLDGTYAVATVPSPTSITFTFNGSLLAGSTVGTMYAYGAGDAWRPTDVGSFVSINGGLVEITEVQNGSSALGRIVKELTATITAPSNSWSLKSYVWNSVDGYPRAVSLYQQRLYAAGSTSFPETIWGSSTGLYFDFTPGTDDADAFSYSAASDQVNEIQHLASSKILTVLTQGEEFTVDGGAASSVTPTNINVRSQSIFGCASARPVRVANELIYAQRAGKKIRSMAYDFNTDSFRSQNLTRLAAHITGPGIVDMAFQAEPNPVVWMVRSDGVLVSMTYDRDDNVCGFARHTTDGLYKSVCVIPGDDSDLVFVVVQRTVNSVTVQYVELFDPEVMTDAAIIGTSATPVNIWTGFASLEGKTCDVKADGVYMGPMTVTGGTITLPRNATSIEVGLHYESQITALTPNVSGGLGTSQGNQQRSGRIILRMLDSTRAVVNGQPIAFRQFGEDVLDQPPLLFTGDKDISDFGWDDSSEITIVQDQPYKWHVLALIRQFTVNNG
jgi:hypothetical protein